MDSLHQSRFLPLMTRPEFYPHPTGFLQERETHISHVFLTGDLVYKIKKPVNLGFLDFTSLDQRRRFCDQELLLNRRLTSGVYLEVVPITFSEEEGYRLGGGGTVVEYAVKMRQLADANTLLSRLEAGTVTPEDLEGLARTLAGFYRRAGTDTRVRNRGSLATIRANCEENFAQAAPFAGRYLDRRRLDAVARATRSFLEHQAVLFEKRITGGSIRDCHGDLRLGHVYFEDGIQIIDCIEFNDRFRFADTAADLAFLIMEMDQYGHGTAAQRLLETFVDLSGDPGVLGVMDFYKCYRAMVRVKVSCFQLDPLPPDQYRKNRLIREARALLDLAYGYASCFSRPAVWVVCGMIASGKSTLARGIAEHLGLEVYSSDRARKALFGLEADAPMTVPYGSGIYSREATSLVYGRLLLQAQELLKQGKGVILDATFARKEDRREVVRLARDLNAGVVFVNCRAPDRLIRERLAAREGRADESDARGMHFKPFKESFEPFDDLLPEVRVQADTRHAPSHLLPQVMAEGQERLRRQVAALLKP